MIIKTINLENYNEVTELIRESLVSQNMVMVMRLNLLIKFVMKKVISKIWKLLLLKMVKSLVTVF